MCVACKRCTWVTLNSNYYNKYLRLVALYVVERARAFASYFYEKNAKTKPIYVEIMTFVEFASINKSRKLFRIDAESFSLNQFEISLTFHFFPFPFFSLFFCFVFYPHIHLIIMITCCFRTSAYENHMLSISWVN